MAGDPARRFANVRPILPVMLLGIVSIWSGNFYSGASAVGAATTWVLVLALASSGVGEWRDPLRLGRSGRLLGWAFLLAVGASFLASPVSRAGLVAIVTLPAWLLLPAAVARSWKNRVDIGRGCSALGMVVSAVALTALLHWATTGAPRPAAPLGHHNLLAGWLVLMTPLALVPLQLPGSPRASKLTAALAGGLGLAAILASGSFAALVALAAQLLLLWMFRHGGLGSSSRRLLWLFPAALCVVALRALPRLAGLAAGHDASLAARWTYFDAGLRALAERPILGWGPGSVPWTIGLFLRPAHGTNPASEIIGDLHSLPLQTAYETGITGLLVAGGLILLFYLRRRLEAGRGTGTVAAHLCLVSFAGGLAMFLGSAPMQVPAMAVALAVSAGACLAVCPAGPRKEESVSDASPARAVCWALYLVGAAVLLAPVAWAHHHYDLASRSAEEVEQRKRLTRALDLDPRFPLYAFRWALLDASATAPDRAALEPARRAATEAPGLAPLWLTAGYLALENGEVWAFDALLAAHRLDPLAPLPAFHLMRSRPDHPMAATWGARALAADPRLGAAVWWQGRPDLWQRSLEAVERGAPATAEALRTAVAGVGDRARGGTVLLALGMDGDRTLSFSLFAFRRSPWRASLAPARLDVGFLEALEATRARIPG